MDRSNTKKKLKYFINAQQQIPVPYGSMLHIPPTNFFSQLLNRSHTKKRISNEKYWKNFSKKFIRINQQAENDKTESVTGLGRSTREEIAKWDQMTALILKTAGRHQTSPASLRWCQHGRFETETVLKAMAYNIFTLWNSVLTSNSATLLCGGKSHRFDWPCLTIFWSNYCSHWIG